MVHWCCSQVLCGTFFSLSLSSALSSSPHVTHALQFIPQQCLRFFYVFVELPKCYSQRCFRMICVFDPQTLSL